MRRKRNDRRQQSLRCQTRDGWIQCSNEGTGTVRIRRTTAGSVRICNVSGKIRNGSDETIVVEEQQIVQTKQAEVAAESVTMPENIKADGAAAKISAKHNICSKKQTEPMQRRRILLKSFLCGLII